MTTASAAPPRLKQSARGYTIAAHDPPLVRGDAQLLRRLLLNLLDNALKHAPAGSSIAVHQQREGDRVTLTVSDAGPGIPADQRERVFERFVHGVHGPTTPLPTAESSGTGAGLGLAIAQAIAHAHGGSITLLDASPGATFKVSLPLIPSAGDPS